MENHFSTLLEQIQDKKITQNSANCPMEYRRYFFFKKMKGVDM